MDTVVDEEKRISKEKKMTVLLLAIAFGYIGMHCFYLGEKKKGIRRLLIGLLIFPLGAILNMIDVIKIAMNKYTVFIEE